MRRLLVLILILILNIVLQSTFMVNIKINNVSPNLLLITTISFSILRGKYEGGMIGLILGLLQDIFFGSSLGFYALIYMNLGFLTGSLFSSFYSEKLLIPLTVIAFSDLLYSLYIYIFTFLLRGKLDFMYYFINIMMPEFVYTGLIATIVYKLYQKIYNKLDIYSKKEGGKQ